MRKHEGCYWANRPLNRVEDVSGGLDKAQISLDRSGLGAKCNELTAQPMGVSRITAPRHGFVVGPPEGRRYIPTISRKA